MRNRCCGRSLFRHGPPDGIGNKSILCFQFLVKGLIFLFSRGQSKISCSTAKSGKFEQPGNIHCLARSKCIVIVWRSNFLQAHLRRAGSGVLDTVSRTSTDTAKLACFFRFCSKHPSWALLPWTAGSCFRSAKVPQCLWLSPCLDLSVINRCTQDYNAKHVAYARAITYNIVYCILSSR